MVKFVKHGKKFALVIEKSILQILGFDENTELDVIVRKRTLIIRAAKPQKALSDDKELDEVTERIIKKYEPVIKKLSKT